MFLSMMIYSRILMMKMKLRAMKMMKVRQMELVKMKATKTLTQMHLAKDEGIVVGYYNEIYLSKHQLLISFMLSNAMYIMLQI